MPGVRSAADVKMLRSGRLCAPLRAGGVRCLGDVGVGTVAPGSRPIHWDDGYCVLERGRKQFRCEWVQPRGAACIGRVIFFEAEAERLFPPAAAG